MTSNSSLQARRIAAVPRGVGTAYPVFASRAEGSELWDVDGNRYIDFAGGIAVLNTGHRHPKVIAAVREQLDNYTHTAFQIVPYEPYIALCERLNGLAPFSGEAKTILFSTGAEAVENAVKIARAATGRTGIIAFGGGFHGRTMMTMALTGKVAPYKKKFGPMPGGVYHLPFPIPQDGVTVADTMRALDLLFRADIEPAHVAAIIIEPVQGEGGFHPAPTELLQALRKVCDEHGILLIADEIQTGFARTGKMFGIENSGVEPDLVTIAKSLAGGFPLSGVIGRAAIMDAPGARRPRRHLCRQPDRLRRGARRARRHRRRAPDRPRQCAGRADQGRSGAHRAAQRHGCRWPPFAGRARWWRSTSSRAAAAPSPTPTRPNG